MTPKKNPDEPTGSTTVPAEPVAANEQAPTSGFTDQEHEMLDAMGTPQDRGARLLMWREGQRTGLDPLAKHLYLTQKWIPDHYEDDCPDYMEHSGHGRFRYAVETTIEGFRTVAVEQPSYAGQTAPQWCGQDCKWMDVWPGDRSHPPTAARVGVYVRGYMEPIWGVAKLSSYNAGGYTWGKMPDHMTAKCAEALALRKAYPRKLSGIYTTEEMEQAHAEEDRKVLEVFSRTQAAVGIHGHAKLANTRQEHLALWDEARKYPGGSLLPVYLSATSSTLEKTLAALADQARAKNPVRWDSAPVQPGAQWAAQGPDVTQHSPSPGVPSQPGMPAMTDGFADPLCQGCGDPVPSGDVGDGLWSGDVRCRTCRSPQPPQASEMPHQGAYAVP